MVSLGEFLLDKTKKIGGKGIINYCDGTYFELCILKYTKKIGHGIITR